MFPKAPLKAAGILVAAVVAASSAQAQDDFWEGPYFGLAIGRDFGLANYHFLTDGYFNDAAGDRFSQPLYGLPLGVVIGHNWQSGDRVFGIEANFYSHTTKAENTCLDLSSHSPMGQWGCGAVSPYDPDQAFDYKGHWFVGFAARLGFVRDRLMFYVQGGPVLGHVVSRVDDETANRWLWVPGTRLGLQGEVGVEVAIGEHWSLGVGFRGTVLYPLRVEGYALDGTTNDPDFGAPTNHRITHIAGAVIARIVYHTGRADRIPPGALTEFNWNGFHFGAYVGALWQFGLQVGYDRVIGDNILVGGSLQLSQNRCCGTVYEVDANARAGYIWRDTILAYGEVGVGYQNGTFFDQVDGLYYHAGVGVEIALTRRMSTFMEAKLIGGDGRGFFEGNFQGGFNFRLGPR